MSAPVVSRRQFLQSAAAATLLGPVVGRADSSPAASGTVNIACVGVGGKGWSDMLETSVGHNIVAICDIDEERLAKAAEQFPKAQRYTDWRRLLDQSDVDALTISTPDHMHAAVTASAMHRDKHVYTQKPLTHDISESRRLAEIAADRKLVTQMGIQHHATARLKLAVHAVQSGVIGKVSEVHAWTDRPGTFWKQGLERPTEADPVPPHVHWDLWLGVAPQRPFAAGVYHPFHWRGWWDFGTGALGDMGCHILDPVVHALELGPPGMVTAEGPEPSAQSGPEWCIVHYQFPGTGHTTDTLSLTWYEAGKQPPRELFKAPADWQGSQNGVLYVGERGNLFVGFPEMPELFPRGDFADFQWPDLQDHNHYTEWTTAIARSGTTSCPFSYSGPLSETVLLGNVAFRSGQPIQWDSQNLKAAGLDAADALIRREYRNGWSVEGLS